MNKAITDCDKHWWGNEQGVDMLEEATPNSKVR